MSVRVASLALLGSLWIALIGTVTWAEALAGGVVVALAVAGYGAMRSQITDQARPRLRWVGEAIRDWPGRILRDTAMVARASLRAGAHPGRVRTVGFADRTTAEQVWSIVGTSISPNAYVIGTDEAARTMLVHELVSTRRPDDQIVWWPR